MTHDPALAALERAELIRLAQRMPEVAYLFRHALVQDAAYGSLLKASRKELHAAIGETIERMYPDQLDELAPVLGRHFAEAEQYARALRYYEQAGDAAAAKFANDEAIAQYGLALAMAERTGAARGDLWRKRGRIGELSGDLPAARADFEAAAAEAHAAGDRRAEWRSLMDLGFLWAAQDYAHTGLYFQQATALAREAGDPRMLAESLNRLGNWHMNTEAPQPARDCHREALALYESLDDTRGLAETYDLLAISALVGGDSVHSLEMLGRVIPLFRALNDRRGESGALANRSACVATVLVHILLAVDRTTVDGIRDGLDALRIAREIGWRAGEAFAEFRAATAALAAGEFSQALERGRTAMQTADAIDHQQWQTLSRISMAAVHHEIGDHARGFATGAEAVLRARRIGSPHLVRLSVGMAGQFAARHGDLTAAAAAEGEIASALGDDAHMTDTLTIGQRHCWTARAELALARDDAAGALELLTAMESSLPQAAGEPQRHSPYLTLLRGDCLLALGRAVDAAGAYTVARDIARAARARPLWCRSELGLARTARALGASSEGPLAVARTLMAEMAATLPDDSSRRVYLARMAAEAGE